MKIVLAASSSGGHVFPCLILGNYLINKGHEVTFIGFKDNYEEKVFPKDNSIFISYPNSFNKALVSKNKNLKNAYYSVKDTIKESDAIIVFGGFISLLVSFFSILNHRRYYIHEQNVTIGDSNKICYLGCKRMFRAFRKNHSRKEVIVGNPSCDMIESREVVFHHPIRVLFVYGSLGSETLNKKTIEFLNAYDVSKYDITIVNKLNNDLKTTNYLQNSPSGKKIQRNNIHYKPFIDLRKELSFYDVIFTRGGATTLMELVNSGAYVIAIPSPFVKHNHQLKNVLYLSKKGLIEFIEEKDYSSFSINEILNYYSSHEEIRFDYYLKRKEYMCKDVSKKIEEYIIYDHKN